ncbi:hypothetical protein K2X89_02350, partial [Myxococcota bacterium]|nr:hypothetical protein [Myxococcota bacterium]
MIGAFFAIASAGLAPESARAACTPTSPPNDETVTCSGTDSTGYDGSGADNLTISTTGAAVLDDSNPNLDAAILVDDDSTVTIGAEATVKVTEQNGAGIRGDDDNFIDNKGRIELNVDDTRGIVIDQNTTGILPNGAVNSSTGVIQVDGNRSYAIETGNNTGVATSGTINLVGDETRGLSGGNRLDYTKPANVTNSGTINVGGDDSFGMRFGDGWLEGTFEDTDDRADTPDEFVPTSGGIRNFQPGTIKVTGARSTGISVGQNSFVVNSGRIELNADDTRGIVIAPNTIATLPNGINNSSTGVILVTGNRSYAIETGTNTGALSSGTITLDGNETRGMSGGSLLDYRKPANATNSGTINVNGADSFGMRFDDGWLLGSLQDTDGRRSTPDELVPSAGAIRNLRPGTINVSGARSTGIYTGQDSFVLNTGTINVTGTDAVGISVTGNSRLERFDLDKLDPTQLNPLGLATVVNQQQVFGDVASITGDADAGPLVVFRGFTAGRENRLYNGVSQGIVANLTNVGTANRGIAIRGTDGDELVANLGRIQGDIEFLGGDDRYVHLAGASLTGGTLYGGNGLDVVTLAGGNGNPASFDLSRLNGFEGLRITSGANWSLTGTSGFTGLTEVLDGATLDVPTEITLGGGLSIEDGATVQVTLKDTTTPLTVQGATSLDGTLVVVKGANLALSATPYRVLQANGGLTGRFDRIVLPAALGSKVFSTEYVDDGLLATYQDVGLVGMARNGNQRVVAQYLVDLTAAGGSATDLQALLNALPNTENVARIYTALSPEGYDAQTTVSIEAGRRIASLLFDRPRECRKGDIDPWNPNPNVLPCHPHRLAPWVTALGSFRSRDGFSGHNRYDSQMGGVIAGLDFRPIDQLALTLAVSSQRGTVNVERTGESKLT